MSEETANPLCSRCGQPLAPGQAECSACGYRSNRSKLQAGGVLLLSFVGLVVFFVLTGFAARFYHAKQKELAEQWLARGNSDLQAGRAKSALEDYRNALSYSPDNTEYRLRLAEALAAANRIEEARTYLLNLRERAPGSGEVNVELARLAARVGDVPEAVGYYHNAIYGVWEEDPQQQRWQARLELFQFLLARGATNDAQAELLELAADVPPNGVTLHARVGNLFLQAGDPRRALQEFELVLKVDRHHAAGLLGAGDAAFEMGDFRQAERYLARAVNINKGDARTSELLETARLALANDPFELGLTDEERARRVVRDFDQALENLKSCAAKLGQSLDVPAPQPELQQAYVNADEIRKQVHSRFLWRHPDQMMQAMERVFEMERVMERTCGPLTGVDQALLLIGKKHRTFER